MSLVELSKATVPGHVPSALLFGVNTMQEAGCALNSLRGVLSQKNLAAIVLMPCGF